MSEPQIIEPRFDVLLAVAEVTRLALEKNEPEVCRGWTRVAEMLCRPAMILRSEP